MIDAYFSGTKIEWLIREGGVDPSAAFGTIDSWLAFKLTGRHVTDYSNASRTLLFDIRERSWDHELCELLSVEPDSLPDPLPSAHMYGETSEFGGGVPVAGIAGDQQAALYGQACHEPGLGKNTYGTGSFLLQNAGGECPPPREGLLTSVAWGVGERVDYLSDAQPDDEMKVSARHTDNGVDDGKAGNPHKPVCSRLYHLFGAHAAQHQIVSRSCSLRGESHSASSHSHLS